MRSIKPGRGPSFMGGFAAIAAVVFGIIWTVAAASMGAPVFFPLFGIVFCAFGIAGAVYNFKNATGKNRYSMYDITDGTEEPDPLNAHFGSDRPVSPERGGGEFCPYCGRRAELDHRFCKGCGKEL